MPIPAIDISPFWVYNYFGGDDMSDVLIAFWVTIYNKIIEGKGKYVQPSDFALELQSRGLITINPDGTVLETA